jgi:hypothetical protein
MIWCPYGDRMNTEFSVGILNPRPSPLELTRISPRLGTDAGLLGLSINLHGNLYLCIDSYVS